MSLPEGSEVVTSTTLVDKVASAILDAKPPAGSTLEEQANFTKNVDDSICNLSELLNGLNVNIKFRGNDQFEFTKELGEEHNTAGPDQARRNILEEETNRHLFTLFLASVNIHASRSH